MLVLLFLFVELQGNDYALIANKALHVKSITYLEAKMIFLKKSKILQGTAIIPINLGINNEVRRSFEKNILHMSRRKLQHYWIAQHYLGNRPPIMMNSPKSILRFVKKVEGAIAYIPLTEVDERVNVLLQWSD